MTPELPAWQRGYDLAELKERTAVFTAHDRGLILGAFTGVSERAVADWLADGKLLERRAAGGPSGGAGQLLALAASWPVQRRVPIRDFTGEQLAQQQPGDTVVRRLAFVPGDGGMDAARALVRAAQHIAHGPGEARLEGARTCWLEAFIEHEADMEIAASLGFRQAGTKIPASSELIGIFWSGQPPALAERLPEEACTLTRLPLLLKGEPGALPERYASHYSSKNVRDSWAALALRGYSDDPAFIAKPAEMSKKWKRENPEKLEWQLRDTPLRAELAWLEPVIALIPGEKHRIRLMRLAPGGGELERHADNTDPDAGVVDGKLLRVHIPLVTNPEVIFEAWRLDGQKVRAHMAQGEAWVLDTRKPHTAVNGGSSERIHLVIDVESGPELRRMLRRGQEAEAV